MIIHQDFLYKVIKESGMLLRAFVRASWPKFHQPNPIARDIRFPIVSRALGSRNTKGNNTHQNYMIAHAYPAFPVFIVGPWGIEFQ